VTDIKETTIFEEGGVKITNLRAVIVTNTYPISKITFVSRQKREPGSAPYWWSLLGMLLLLIGFLDMDRFWGILIAGLIIFFAGTYTIRRARTSYVVRIGSAGVEIDIFASQDQEYIKRIVEAMNTALSDAIVRQGEAEDDLHQAIQE
jgi:hypothetical protein